MNLNKVLVGNVKVTWVAVAVGALAGCVAVEPDTLDARFRPSRYRSTLSSSSMPATADAVARVSIGKRQVVAAAAGRGNKVVNHYLALLAKKKADNGFGVIPIPWVLYAPFRTQVQVGLFNSKRAEKSLGGQGCIETDDKDTALPSLKFDVICLQFVAGGAVLRAWDQRSSFFSPIARIDLPGTTDAHLAIEHDGVMQTRFMYSFNGASWITLAVKASDPLTKGRTIGVGGSLLPGKAEIGFDNFGIPWNGPVDMPTASKLAREYTFKALLHSNNAHNLIDGGGQGFAAAIANIDQGLHNSDLARMQLETYVSGSEATMKRIKKAIKALAKGDKDLNKARTKVLDQKAKPALKKLVKAIKDYDRAILDSTIVF